MSRSDRPLLPTVRSVETTCDFYSQVLRMEGVEFERDRRTFEFRRHKINLPAS